MGLSDLMKEKMMKHEAFLQIAGSLNSDLHIIPLLFGSLGLQKRLNTDLYADDIDILIPEAYLTDGWDRLCSLMAAHGYALFDAEEHAFKKGEICAAFASIESLTPFAGVDLRQIPTVTENGVRYYLLTLSDYLKVYAASAKDGYRKNVKHKQDQHKIDLIKKALGCLTLTSTPFGSPEPMLRKSVDAMVKAIVGALSENAPSIYLFGSVALGDFRFGWSDIDLLVLTEKQISSEQAGRLLHLRQDMTGREPENPYYRLFEGGMLRLSAFLKDTPDTVVYWGTSGERVTDRYVFNSLCMLELLDHGVLLYGGDVRDLLRRPSYEDLRTDVRRYYETIREHGGNTGRSLYSLGWLLDISRCIYTLRTGKIIAKTNAGEWALENGLCPDASALQTALRVRKEPGIFHKDTGIQTYAVDVGNAVQQYADVLERELKRDIK